MYKKNELFTKKLIYKKRKISIYKEKRSKYISHSPIPLTFPSFQTTQKPYILFPRSVLFHFHISIQTEQRVLWNIQSSTFYLVLTTIVSKKIGEKKNSLSGRLKL
jgi:hypothetical protein